MSSRLCCKMSFWISILVVILSCGHTSAVVDKRFPTNRNGDKITNVVEKDGFLYVAENGILHELDLGLTSIKSFNTCASDNCNNINKVLAVSGELLVLCGSGNNGVCQALKGSEVQYSSSSESSYVNYLAVSTDINKSAVGLAFEGDFYLGVSYGQNMGIKTISGTTYKYYISRTVIDRSFNLKACVYLLNEDYPVYFKTVFQHRRYIYFLTIQRENLASSQFVSKLIRICVDEKYNAKQIKSYTDIILSCGSNSTSYNLLQDADFLPAKGVLVAAFSQGDDPKHPTTDSAVCVYTMEAVNNAILAAKDDSITCATKNYSEVRPSAYIEIDLQRCLSKSEYEILSEDYICPMDPLSGSKVIGFTPPLQPNSTYKFNNSKITKVTGIDRYGLYPDVFIGTDTGTISKFSVDDSLQIYMYETNTVIDRGHPVMDIHIGEDKTYIVTNRKISSYKNPNCSSQKTCKETMQLKNPSCGWCLVDNKSTKRSDCSDGWISSLSECVSIDVSPEYIPTSAVFTTKLTITARNVPHHVPTEMKCRYTQNNNQIGSLVDAVRVRENVFTCSISSYLQHVELTLQLATALHYFVYAETTIQIYDCSFYKSCGSCLHSPDIKCQWCATSLTCQTTSSSCDMHVTDRARCPRLETSEIYLPNGITKEITLNVTNMVTALGYVCSIDQNETHFVVHALVENNSIKCVFNVSFVEDHPKMALPLSVYQVEGQTSVKIENTFNVTVYKCEYLAVDCTRCGALKPSRYDCKWCQSGKCGHKTRCTQNVSCPLPQITKVYPPSGGYKGGTKLQITGTNFGTISNNILDVMIGDERCNEHYVLHVSSPDFDDVNKEIRCVSGFSIDIGRIGSKNVTFEFDGIRSGYGRYSFLNPVVTKIEPSFGPAIGGTLITLSGTDLDIGGSVRFVRMGNVGMCSNVIRNRNQLTCITQPIKSAFIVTSVRLFLGSEFYQSLVTFRFLSTPSITEISTNMSILSGGTVVLAVGINLKNAARVFIIAHYAGEQKVVECITSFDTTLECPFPQAPPTAVGELVENTQGNRKWRSAIDISIRIDISIKMDGYVKTFEVDYFRDPVVEPLRETIMIPYSGKRRLTITGDYLNLAAGPNDYKVLISDGNCLVIDVSSSNITCIPPEDNPDETSEDLEVEVELGNFKQTVGYVRYEVKGPPTDAHNAQYTLGIVLSGVGGVLFIAIIVGVVMFCYMYRRAKARIPKIKMQKRKKSDEQNEMSEIYLSVYVFKAIHVCQVHPDRRPSLWLIIIQTIARSSSVQTTWTLTKIAVDQFTRILITMATIT